MRYGNEAMRMVEELDLDEVRAQLLNTFGSWRVMHGDTRGLEEIAESVAIFERLNSAAAQRSYNNLADGYYNLGDLQRSAEATEADEGGVEALLAPRLAPLGRQPGDQAPLHGRSLATMCLGSPTGGWMTLRPGGALPRASLEGAARADRPGTGRHGGRARRECGRAGVRPSAARLAAPDSDSRLPLPGALGGGRTSGAEEPRGRACRPGAAGRRSTLPPSGSRKWQWRWSASGSSRSWMRLPRACRPRLHGGRAGSLSAAEMRRRQRRSSVRWAPGR